MTHKTLPQQRKATETSTQKVQVIPGPQPPPAQLRRYEKVTKPPEDLQLPWRGCRGWTRRGNSTRGSPCYRTRVCEIPRRIEFRFGRSSFKVLFLHVILWWFIFFYGWSKSFLFDVLRVRGLNLWVWLILFFCDVSFQGITDFDSTKTRRSL